MNFQCKNLDISSTIFPPPPIIFIFPIAEDFNDPSQSLHRSGRQDLRPEDGASSCLFSSSPLRATLHSGFVRLQIRACGVFGLLMLASSLACSDLTSNFPAQIV